jgi:hypothetical protein
MRTSLLFVAALALTACAKEVEVESDGSVDTTTRLTVPDIDVGVKTDTVNVPTVGTKKDTIIVDKPVVTGKKQVEVKRPTVDVNRKP